MKILCRLVVLLFVGLAMVLSHRDAQGGGDTASSTESYTITPNSGSINAIVAAQPAGTIFSLACGTYRMQQTINPLAGDSFVGAGAISGVPGSPPCADLNGAMVLNGWTTGRGGSAGTWYETVASADVISSHSAAQCNSTHFGGTDIGCEYPQDLFFNSVPKTHVTASFPPLTGQWYLDYAGKVGQQVANTVYVGDDPNGSTVELSVTPTAFAGPASNVTIRNLTIEKYATSTQQGAVITTGYHWTIDNNWLDLNHGAAILLDGASSGLVTYNRTTRNGETGLASSGGVNNTFSHNVSTQNNFAGIWYSFEAGGGKFSGESNLLVINNTVSNNNGNGLWGDGGDTNALFSGNTVDHNLYNGIAYEISYSGTIIRNTLIDNTQAAASQCIAAHLPILNDKDVCTGAGTCSGAGCMACDNNTKSEIWVHTSSNTTVGGSPGNGNTITSNCAGIQISGDVRLKVVGNAVTYNKLVLHKGSAVLNTRVGANNNTTKYNLYTASPPNYFDYNDYTFDNRTASRTDLQWQWALNGGPGNQTYNWAGWPQDAHGSVSP